MSKAFRHGWPRASLKIARLADWAFGLTMLPFISCVCLLSACYFFYAPYPAFCAAIPPQLVRDLSPVYARVMEVEDERLVLWLREDVTIKKGDLFTVYGKGELYRDPQTGVVLGTMRRPLAVVQALKTREGRVTCRMLSVSGPVKTGLAAVRFSDVNAMVVADSRVPVLSMVARRLLDSLPALSWQQAPSSLGFLAGKSALKGLKTKVLLVLTGQQARLFLSGLKEPRVYPLELVNGTKEGARSKISTNPAAVSPLVPRDSAPELIGTLSQEALQVEVSKGGGGKEWILYLMPQGLYLARYGEKGPPWFYKLPSMGTPAGFSVSDQGDWMVLNVMIGGVGMRSSLFKWGKRGIRLVQGDINLWLGFVDFDGDGVRNELVGQRYEVIPGEKEGNAYLLTPTERGVTYDDDLKMPRGAFLPASARVDMDGDGEPELCSIGLDGRFRVFVRGKEVWVAPDSIAIPAPFDGVLLTPRPVDDDVDGRWELAVAAINSKKEDSYQGISLLKFVNGRYSLIPLNLFPSGRIVGLAMEGGKIFYAISKEGKADLYRLR